MGFVGEVDALLGVFGGFVAPFERDGEEFQVVRAIGEGGDGLDVRGEQDAHTDLVGVEPLVGVGY